jgi:hypothetical protein
LYGLYDTIETNSYSGPRVVFQLIAYIFSVCHLFTTWTDLAALPLQVASDLSRESVAAVSGRGQGTAGAIGLSNMDSASLDHNREQLSDEDLLD